VPEARSTATELIHREIFREVVERPLLHRGHRGLDGREAGDHDDGQRGIELVGAPEQRQAVHARHLEVGQHQVGTLALEDRQRGRAVPGRRARIALTREDARAVLEHVGLVVDDQNARSAHLAPEIIAEKPFQIKSRRIGRGGGAAGARPPRSGIAAPQCVPTGRA
jgi:hypothetical protein